MGHLGVRSDTNSQREREDYGEFVRHCDGTQTELNGHEKALSSSQKAHICGLESLAVKGTFFEQMREEWNLPSRRLPIRGDEFFSVGQSSAFSDRLLAGHPWFQAHPQSGLDVLVVVTTFERATSCLRVLRQIARCLEEAKDARVRVLVLEDKSEQDYKETITVARELFGESLLWLTARAHHGKRRFWVAYQFAFSCAQALAPGHVLFLQDDLEFSATLLTKALHLDARLRDAVNPKGAQVLNLYAAADDERSGRWVNFTRVPVPGLPVEQTQWFDLAGFLMDRATLEILRYRVIPVGHKRWEIDPSLSSGVGRQLTRRLRTRARIYQCSAPLVFHGAEKSVMHPMERERRPLDNRPLKRRPPAMGAA